MARLKLAGMVAMLSWGTVFAGEATPDPRSLALAGAVTSTTEGIHSISYNPARLAFTSRDLSMILGAGTFAFENNLISMTTYNEINGADFIDPISPDYINKDEFLDGIPKDGLRFRANVYLPLPVVNYAKGNLAFSSRQMIYGDLGIPRALFRVLMRGNPVGQELNLEINEEILGVSEWGLSFTIPSEDMAFGVTLKYLQGLFYIGIDPDSSGGYFITDSSYFRGEGRYLIRQAVGGGGLGLDLGFATREINGYRLGISLINAYGRIQWQGTSITKQLVGDVIQNFMPWRENEYYLYTFRINDVNAERLLQDMPRDSLFQTEQYTVIEVPDSGLVRSDNRADISGVTPKPFIITYPALFRMGISKTIEGFGSVSVDLITGFQDRLWSSRRWQLAVGVESTQVPGFPVRMGWRFASRDEQQLAMGFGIHKGSLQFDLGLAFHNGLWLHTAKGLSLAAGLTLVR